MNKWKKNMTEYDKNLNQRLDVKEGYLTDKIVDVYCWNKLSLSEYDGKFPEDFNRIFNYDNLAHTNDYK